jgi:hypothetical protein
MGCHVYPCFVPSASHLPGLKANVRCSHTRYRETFTACEILLVRVTHAWQDGTDSSALQANTQIAVKVCCCIKQTCGAVFALTAQKVVRAPEEGSNAFKILP